MKTTLFSSALGEIPANLAFHNNFAGAVAPGVGDDSGDKYQVGSVWVDVVAKVAYVCIDATAGAAVWNVAGTGGLTPAELAVLDGVTPGTAAPGKANVLDSAGGLTAFRSGRNLRTQGAPAAKTVTATLTAAEIIAGLLTANPGGSAVATYTMPLGTDIETALLALFPGLATGDSFDFSITNISTDAAEDVTVAGNTGTTAVGNMTIASNAAVTDQAWGTFRVRRTGANAYSFYRIG